MEVFVVGMGIINLILFPIISSSLTIAVNILRVFGWSQTHVIIASARRAFLRLTGGFETCRGGMCRGRGTIN